MRTTLAGIRNLSYRPDTFLPDRLHRGGDRQANTALWRIALVRMHCHPPTKDYVTRRTAEGKTKTDILRCLKRYIAREVFPHLLAASTSAGSTQTRCAEQR